MKKETLEQAAKQWAYDWGNDSGYNSRTDDLEDGFIAGASWREQQAASGLQEWWESVAKEAYRTKPTLDVEKTWQAAQLSSAKLLAEKDAEIAELKKKTGFKTGFYIRECNNCGHDWSRDD